MSFFLSREESRRVDRIAIEQFGFSGLVLMENAGRGCAEFIRSFPVEGPISICCGKGNNGGDGFVIARFLKIFGRSPNVFLFADPFELRGDAKTNYEILTRCDVPIHVLSEPEEEFVEELKDSGIVVDALLGTGATGPPRKPIDSVIRSINAARKVHDFHVVAIDLPSGLDADTGTPNDPTIRADTTLTFVRPKKGFLQPVAVPFLGNVETIGIGVPEEVVKKA